jgi:NAD(P)H-hydrate epimerase
MSAAAFGLAEARAVMALAPRAADANKYHARVLLVAGSAQYLGAALLCARGAYRGGAGYVQMALPQDLAPSAMSALPEAVVAGLPATGNLGPAHLDAVLDLASKAGAVAVGPGLGRSEPSQALVRALWERLPQAAVFDADALAALPTAPSPGGPRVLTPHEGELKALLGPAALDRGRDFAAQALAERYACVGLLKGPGTLVSAPGERLSVNSADSPALATAGTGDVLAGLIAALLAQGCAPFGAAALGAWLHGRAAQRWAEAHAGRGLMAGDLADSIPLALADAGA